MKLIIDIPKDLYDMTRTPNNVNYIMRMAGFICSAIAKGTPLDDVKAEIHRESLMCGDVKKAEAFNKTVAIIDKHIGKAESEDKE